MLTCFTNKVFSQTSADVCYCFEMLTSLSATGKSAKRRARARNAEGNRAQRRAGKGAP